MTPDERDERIDSLLSGATITPQAREINRLRAENASLKAQLRESQQEACLSMLKEMDRLRAENKELRADIRKRLEE